MSTSNLGRKVVWFVLVVLMLNLVVNLFRHLAKQRNLAVRIQEKEVLRQQLKEENIRLEKQLELVQSPEYIKEQAGKLLGLDNSSLPTEVKDGNEVVNQLITVPVPNYKKWVNLFFY